jgi:hypothetical protein
LYAYNCGGPWEAHFRETAAHNTATVDGRDQALHINKMAWSHSYRAIAEAWNPEAGAAWVIGSHDGYARGPNGVVHRRAVWLREDASLLIYDEFVGTGAHEFVVHFQFAPGRLEHHPGSDTAGFDGEVDVAWIGSERWSAVTACGGPGPADGWIAPSLGIRQAAPRLSLRLVTAQPRATLLTVMATRRGANRLDESQLRHDAAKIQALVASRTDLAGVTR